MCSKTEILRNSFYVPRKLVKQWIEVDVEAKQQKSLQSRNPGVGSQIDLDSRRIVRQA